MRTFEPYKLNAVNGLDGDPAVFALFKKTGVACLFDLGDLSALSHRDILRVRHVFISHTHMDHFIGFDRLLRVHVPHRRVISCYGPPGLIQSIRYRILSYTWNLIDDDQVQFDVYEIDYQKGELRRALLRKADQFAASHIHVENLADPIAILSDGSRVNAVALKHKDIDSIAYQLEAPMHSKVDVSCFAELGLKPGPWIKDLQTLFARDKLDGEIEVWGQSHKAKDLAKRLIYDAKTYRLSYLTDLSFCEHNLKRLLAQFKACTRVISECNYADKDRNKAVAKAHLTSRQAALIAAALKAEELSVFHISNIYAGNVIDVVNEAEDFFQAYKKLPEDQLQVEIQRELKACNSGH